MQAICAALMRNFVDARVRCLEEVLEWSGSDTPDREASCLLIPAFCSGAVEVSDRIKQATWGLLSDRERAGRPTVLFASSMEAVKTSFGKAVFEVLSSNSFPKVQL